MGAGKCVGAGTGVATAVGVSKGAGVGPKVAVGLGEGAIVGLGVGVDAFPGVGEGIPVGGTAADMISRLSSGRTSRTVLPDMAKPNPSVEIPASVRSMPKETMPTTSPDAERRGPPLLPGLKGASVCNTRDLCSVS